MPMLSAISRTLFGTMVLTAFVILGCTQKQSNNRDTDTATETDTAIDTTTDTVTSISSDFPNASDSAHDSDIDNDSDPKPCVEDEGLATKDADTLFNYDHVPTFDIALPQDSWENLQANARDEEWTQVDACFEGKRIGSVGLRFKGSYGTLYGCFDDDGNLTCPRLSMKLKFSKYDEDLRFFGLKRLNFHANRYDDSRMREKLAYDLYRAMDIPAPRASWAVVRVNGKSYGLYGMVEEMDGRFTADRWPQYPNGNLYKEIWPTETNESGIISGLKTNEDEANVGSFLAFSHAIDSANTDEEILRALGQYTDLDMWARYNAVDEAILSYDGITYFYTDTGAWSGNHNYYFYEDSPGHFTLIPWDVESSFWINPDHAPPHWTEMPDDCSTTYPYWGGLATAPGCDPIFRALTTDIDRWRAAAQDVLDGPFAEETMVSAIDAHEAFIREHARAEETPTMFATFDAAVDNLRSSIPILRSHMADQIGD